MYNFLNTKSSFHIGDSLYNINYNYNTLDTWTQNILLSAETLWQPLVDLFYGHKIDWENSLSLVQQYSAAWVSVSTTVETNSAFWIKPLSIFYPEIYSIDTPLNDISTTMETWLNQNFPVLSQDGVRPNYIENQEAFVYVYSYIIRNTVKETETLRDSTVCKTQDGTVYATCKTEFSGKAFCSNGDLTCTGQSVSCNKKQYVECYYNSPPEGPYITSDGYRTVSVPQEPIQVVDEDGNVSYTAAPDLVTQVYGTDNTSGLSYISANVNVYFQNRSESTRINFFKYVVKDCKWYFAAVQPRGVVVDTEILKQDGFSITTQNGDLINWQ